MVTGCGSRCGSTVMVGTVQSVGIDDYCEIVGWDSERRTSNHHELLRLGGGYGARHERAGWTNCPWKRNEKTLGVCRQRAEF